MYKQQKEESEIHSFKEVFQEPMGLVPKRGDEHEIHLQPDAPLARIVYTIYSWEQVKKHLHDSLEQGVMRPSTTPWYLPILIVPNKDGTWRMCIDYKALNKIIIKNWYRLPSIDDLMNHLQMQGTSPKWICVMVITKFKWKRNTFGRHIQDKVRII